MVIGSVEVSTTRTLICYHRRLDLIEFMLQRAEGADKVTWNSNELPSTITRHFGSITMKEVLYYCDVTYENGVHTAPGLQVNRFELVDGAMTASQINYISTRCRS